MFRTAILDVSKRCGRRCIYRNPKPRSGFVSQLLMNMHVNQLRLNTRCGPRNAAFNSNSWISSQKRPAAFTPPGAGNRARLSRVVFCGYANKHTLLCQRLLVAVVELELPWFIWKVTLWAHMIAVLLCKMSVQRKHLESITWIHWEASVLLVICQESWLYGCSVGFYMQIIKKRPRF